MHFPGFPAPPLVSAAPRARLRCAAELASPCWPLQGLLFKICTSIENWLNADPLNVAVVHCMVRRGAGGLSFTSSYRLLPSLSQTGKGRTACVCACALAWLGEMDSPTAALDYVCERRGSSVDAMCVPSQVSSWHPATLLRLRPPCHRCTRPHGRRATRATSTTCSTA